jgi:hypothetical protein
MFRLWVAGKHDYGTRAILHKLLGGMSAGGGGGDQNWRKGNMPNISNINLK